MLHEFICLSEVAEEQRSGGRHEIPQRGLLPERPPEPASKVPVLVRSEIRARVRLQRQRRQHVVKPTDITTEKLGLLY